MARQTGTESSAEDEPVASTESLTVPSDEPKHADDTRLGTVIDGFRIIEQLGRGGHASVFRAIHDDGRTVAIKILHAKHSGDGRARKRLLREAYVANRIGHPSVPRVLGDGMTPDGVAYLVVEFCEGQTLQDNRKAAPNGLAWENVAPWIDELLDVLAIAHDLSIVHRDIKPGNLLVTRDGKLKVLDFGIARVVDASKVPSIVTSTGVVLGTPHFMPPEQAIGNSHEIDGRSDIWSVGATMFTLLTARYVHPARSVNQAIALAVTQHAPKIRSVKPDVPLAIATVVDRALAFDMQARFPNARAMQDALRRALRGETVETPQAEPIVTLPKESETAPALAQGSVQTPEETALVAPRKRWLPTVIATGILGAATGTIFVWPGMGRQTPAVLASSSADGTNALAPVASAPAAQQIAPAERRVKLVVFPVDAIVTVDDRDVSLDNGAVPLVGTLGSVHKVRARKGDREVTQDVAITEQGATPGELRLPDSETNTRKTSAISTPRAAPSASTMSEIRSVYK